MSVAHHETPDFSIAAVKNRTSHLFLCSRITPGA
jgi:hypothetical protein